MNILDLVQELNLSPKHSASTNGGEYKSKCPNCQCGTDRFCIWPNQGESGRYWCRVCGAKGDAIQFCRDFLQMNFQQACKKVNIVPQLRIEPQKSKRGAFLPRQGFSTHPSWKQLASQFIEYAHESLMREPGIISQLEQRGLTFETIRRFHLGWNQKNLFDHRERWGLSTETKENGSLRRQWLPRGIVIPTFEDSDPVKVKIRRSDWLIEDTLPKYVEVSGSKQSASIYGDSSKPVIIVESELDAILIQQEAAPLICCLALGGVSKKPDLALHEWLEKAPLILLSLDFDDAGKKHYSFWIKQYPNLRAWPAPYSKSPGDAFQISSLDFARWIKSGLAVN